MLIIFNDNMDIALKINADGIHIGQDDISCLEVRKILGENKIIGGINKNKTESSMKVKKTYFIK